MKKRIGVIIGVGAIPIAMMLGGCSSEPVMLEYKGKQYDVDTLSELVENEIELQNPEYDLDVQVMFDEEE